MGKHDHPSLQFLVEGGRLVPAGPYEAEVLDTYSRGAQLTVTLHQKRSLPLLKKYWAVLRDVVSNCKTQWESPDEASDALKLALGVTDVSKTVNGQMFVRPGSISFTSMDEAKFRKFFEDAMMILAHVTGIDPAELNRRYNHITEQDQPGDPDPSSPAEGSGEDSPSVSAPDPSTAVDLEEAGASEEDHGGSSASASDLFGETPLKTFGRRIVAAIGAEAEFVLHEGNLLVKELGITDDAAKAKAWAATKHAARACKDYQKEDRQDRAAAVRFIAGIVGAEEKELVG